MFSNPILLAITRFTHRPRYCFRRKVHGKACWTPTQLTSTFPPVSALPPLISLSSSRLVSSPLLSCRVASWWLLQSSMILQHCMQSVTFDPFMYLSVPIPVRNEKMVAVVMLPRIRTRYVVGSTSTGLSAQEAASGERRSVAVLCCAVL